MTLRSAFFCDIVGGIEVGRFDIETYAIASHAGEYVMTWLLMILVRNAGSRSLTGLQKRDCRVRRLLAGYDALLTVPDCQEDSASAWSWIFHLCFLGFVDEVLRRHTPLTHSHRIEQSDPPALFEMKCRRRPDLMHMTILPFGTENLYEPKERLLITQKGGN